MKRYGKCGGKASWIVIWYEQYGRKTSCIMKIDGKYGRKSVEEWKILKIWKKPRLNSEMIWKKSKLNSEKIGKIWK